jgi:hypothetical protein
MLVCLVEIKQKGMMERKIENKRKLTHERVKSK